MVGMIRMSNGKNIKTELTAPESHVQYFLDHNEEYLLLLLSSNSISGHNSSVHGVQSRDVPNASVDGSASKPKCR